MANTSLNEYIAGLLSQAAYTLPTIEHAQFAGSTSLKALGWTDITSDISSNLSSPVKFYDGDLTSYENEFRIFVNTVSKELVIAFKGSDKLGNLVSDLLPNDQGNSAYQSIAAKAQVYYEYVRDNYTGFSNPAENYTIYTDGHSLGGGMAQSFSLKNRLDGFGQNSLPISTLFLNSNTNTIADYRSSHRFDEVNVDGDIATGYYSHLQNGQYLDPTPRTLTSPYGTRENVLLALSAIPGVGAFGAAAAFATGVQAHLLDSYLALIREQDHIGQDRGTAPSAEEIAAINASLVNVTSATANASGSLTVTQSDGTISDVFGPPLSELKAVTSAENAGDAASAIVFGGEGNNVEIARGDGSILISGSGNTTMVGGAGTDAFVYMTATDGSPTTATIDSASGDGAVWVFSGQGNTRLSGSSTAGSQFAWTGDDGVTKYRYVPDSPSELLSGTGTLTISEGVLANAGNQIVIDGFDLDKAETDPNGYLGIKFLEQVALGTGTSAASPFAGPPPTNQSGNLASGGAATFTLYASAASDIAQTFSLSLAGGSGGDYAISTGAELLDFGNGTVTITIPAGEASITLALINTGDPGADESLQLTATLLGADGSSTGISSSALTFVYAEAAAPTQGPPSRVINGDLTPVLTNSGNFQYDGLGNLIVDPGVPAPNRDDTLYGSVGNDLIATGGGNNYVDATQNGADTISGGSGTDQIYGGNGNNTISGKGGANIVVAGNGNNQIYADTQTDLATALEAASGIASGAQGSFLAVGDGDNTIVGGAGNDAIFTGTGNNVIVCGPGAVSIVGGVETASVATSWYTTLEGGRLIFHDVNAESAPVSAAAPYYGSTFDGIPVGTGNNTIYGGTGDSHYYLSNGNNYLDAGSGNDHIHAGVGENTIFGGAGNDTIFGGGGSSYIALESGDDIVVAQGGNNTIIGGSGNDTIYSGTADSDWASSVLTSNNYIYGGSGDAAIFGSGGNDTLIGGTGNASIYGGDGNEYIVGGTGNVSINGGAGNNTIYAGGNGTDTIIAGTGATTIYGGDGTDVLQGGSGTNVIYAGNGGTSGARTQVLAGTGDTTIYGGLGVDYLQGGAGNNVIYAGDGGTDDAPTQVLAGSGNTTIYGGAGTAILQGGAGNSTLVAGVGNETLLGGSGRNTFVINSGFRNIAIGSASPTSYGNVLQFAGDITPDQLNVAAGLDSNGNPVLQIVAGGSITVGGGVQHFISGVQFGDGPLLSEAVFLRQVGALSDTLAGADGSLFFNVDDNAQVVAGSGQDSISSWGNNATLIGGSGDDEIFAEGSNDLLQGGSGNDTLTAYGVGDTLIGGSGSTTLVAYGPLQTLISGTGTTKFEIHDAGATIIELSASNSDSVEAAVSYTLPDNLAALTLLGSAALVATGNSLDNVITGNAGNSTLVAGSGNDTLIAGSGITTMIGGSGNDTFVVNNSSDVIEAWNGGTVLSSVSYALSVGLSNLMLTGSADLFATGNDGAGTLTGNAGRDTLIAGDGDETLVAGSGLATMVGGAGHNTFVVNNSADVIVAQSDALSNVVRSSADYVIAENVTMLTLVGSADLTATGNDQDNTIVGNSGNDTLIAGTGNETLVGGAGRNTFMFNAGFGHDELINASGGVVSFGAGISANDLIASAGIGRDGAAALVLSTATGSIKIDDAFEGAIESFSFSDGSSLTFDQLLQQSASADSSAVGPNGNLLLALTDSAYFTGGQGNDTLVGYGNADTLVAGDGRQLLIAGGDNDVLMAGSGLDTLRGGTGNDTLVAGSGNSTLIGGTASDSYVLTSGGLVEIEAKTSNGIETIWLPQGKQLTDFRPVKSGSDLIMQSGQGDTTVIVKDIFTLESPGREWLVASDSEAPQPLLLALELNLGIDESAAANDYDRVTANALARFRAQLPGALQSLGQSGGSLGTQTPVSPGGGYYNFGVYYNGSWQVPLGSYTFNGITSVNLSVGDATYVVASSESGQQALLNTVQSVETQIPIYQTVISGASSTFIPYPFQLYSGIFTPVGGTVTPVFGAPNPDGVQHDAGDNGLSLLGYEVTTPGVAHQVLVGYSTSTKSVSIGTEVVTRAFTTYNITTDSNDHVITSQGPFRGSVILGDGNDFVDLSGGTPSSETLGSFIQAGAGNDTLIGASGDDVFVAGSGSDFITGGTGANTYYVPLSGTASEVIHNTARTFWLPYDKGNHGQFPSIPTSPAPLPQSTLMLPNGIKPSDLNYRLINDPAYPGDVVLQLNYGYSNVFIPTGEQVFLGGQFLGHILVSDSDTVTGIQQFHFDDGTVLNYDQLLAQAKLMQADQRLVEGLGAGPATLVGGSENDTFVGGLRLDTFALGVNGGQDVIDDSAKENASQTSNDVIQFGAGISFTDLRLKTQGNDLLLSYGASNDTVLLINATPQVLKGDLILNRLQFNDGSYSFIGSDGYGGWIATNYDDQARELGQSSWSAFGDASTTSVNPDTGESETIGFYNDGWGQSRYDNIVLPNGVSEFKSTYSSPDGINTSDAVAQPDGSSQETYSNEWVGGAYERGVRSYNAVTNEYTKTAVARNPNALTAGAGAPYVTITDVPDLTNWIGSAEHSFTLSGNGYSEQVGTETFADGSTYTETSTRDTSYSHVIWNRSDGSYGTVDQNLATGEKTGTNITVGAPFSYAFDNSFLGDGVSESKITYTYDDGSTYFTDTVTQADSSFHETWSKSDGTHGTVDYDAVTHESTSTNAAKVAIDLDLNDMLPGNSASETNLVGGSSYRSSYLAEPVTQPAGSYPEGWIDDGTTVATQPAAVGNAIAQLVLDNGNDPALLNGGSSTVVGDGIRVFNTSVGVLATSLDGNDKTEKFQIEGATNLQPLSQRFGNAFDFSAMGGLSQIDLSHYGATANRLHVIGDGQHKVLINSQVDALVNAMAAFNPPSSGATGLPESHQIQLHSMIAASLH